MKLILEILITGVCLFFIYSYVVKKDQAAQMDAAPINLHEGVMAIQDESDIYKYADGLGYGASDEMEVLAKQEADRMIKTGDISQYKTEIEKNRLLSKMGGL